MLPAVLFATAGLESVQAARVLMRRLVIEEVKSHKAFFAYENTSRLQNCMFTRRVKSKFPSSLVFASDREEISSIHGLVAPSPSDRESSADCIVCLKIGGWRETGVLSAVPALGPSGQCCVVAVKTGIRCREESVASREKYYRWWDVAGTQTLETFNYTL